MPEAKVVKHRFDEHTLKIEKQQETIQKLRKKMKKLQDQLSRSRKAAKDSLKTVLHNLAKNYSENEITLLFPSLMIKF